MTEAWLSEAGVPFEVKNVVRDPAALEAFLAAGGLLPPIVVIDGVAVRGYDPDRLEVLLFGPPG